MPVIPATRVFSSSLQKDDPEDSADVAAQHVEIEGAVCVIGGGIAGLVAASRLARDRNRKVIVLESGLRMPTPEHNALNKIEHPAQQYVQALEHRSRSLGGTGLLWGGRLLPLTDHDVGTRPELDVPAWPLDFGELHRYRPEIETLFGVDEFSYEEEAAERIGLPNLMATQDAQVTLRFPKWVDFSKRNVAALLGEQIVQADNLEIWLGATACAFQLDPASGRLASVTATSLSGKTLAVRASEYLIAAHTMESTRLLLLLDLDAHGRPFEDCRALGHYFNDHLGANLAAFVPVDFAAANRAFGYHFLRGTRRSVHLDISAHTQDRLQVGAGFAQVFVNLADSSPLGTIRKLLRGLQRGSLGVSRADGRELLKSPVEVLRTLYGRYAQKLLVWPRDCSFSFGIWIEQLPRHRNRLSLSEDRDELGIPRLRLHWTRSEEDENTFRACARTLEAYWQRRGLNRIARLDWVADLDEPGAILERSSDLAHPAGSTRMGTSAAESVVGPDLRVHAVTNLSVASASVFPSSAAANPTYTIVQLAMRAADNIAARL